MSNFPGSGPFNFEVGEQPEARSEVWDSKPIYVIDGPRTLEFFTTGALAKALNRHIFTIRKWERDGVIPLARWRDLKNRRIYPRSHVEALIEAAKQFGISQPKGRPQGLPKGFIELAYEIMARDP